MSGLFSLFGTKKNTGRIGLANQRLGAAAEFKASSYKKRLEATRSTLHPGVEIGPGLPLGRIGEKTIYQGWRQCALQVQGPGRGKTAGQVVPHAIAAPGPLVVASNKVDGLWEVIADRMFKGNIIIFDPMNVMNRARPNTEKFNLLGMVNDSLDAEQLGGIFEAATSGQGPAAGNVNAHFDREGGKTLGRLMLAANLAGLGDQKVYEWVMASEANEPARILREHGQTNQAVGLLGLMRQPSDTKGSVWATAQRSAAPFEHEDYLAALRPEEGDTVFDPEAFLNSSDTLILLGQKKLGSTSALVSALVWDLFRTAERTARRSGGRLEVPLVMELDELGNAIALPELPDWYTYAGSLGIVISSYLQGRSQGKRSFSEDDIEQLMGVASVLVYGGGSIEEKFLSALSKVIGRYDHKFTTHSSNYNPGSGHGSSSSTQVQERDILSPADLAQLPFGTMYVRTGDGDAGLVRTDFWFNNPEISERMNLQTQQLKSANHLE